MNKKWTTIITKIETIKSNKNKIDFVRCQEIKEKLNNLYRINIIILLEKIPNKYK